MNKKAYWFITGFCWGISPWIFEIAQSARGGDEVYIGGEIMIFIVPFIIKLICAMYKDCLEWIGMLIVGLEERIECKNDVIRDNKRNRAA